MGITGSIVVYVIIWWIVFFSVLPIGIKHSEKPFKSNLEGIDPGAPKNPNILNLELSFQRPSCYKVYT